MKRSSSYRRSAAAISVIALAITAAMVGSAGAAQGTTTLTFKEPEKGSTVTFVDNGD